MGNQMTEMLKGTLEGIVLAILAARPAYGYEITARLREQGFSDLVEGTVYALLVRIEQRGFVDVEKVPSEKGPPRKVYSLNARGREQLEEFWRTWSFLAERIEQLHREHNNQTTKERSNHGREVDRVPHRVARRQEGVPAVQGPHRGAARAVRDGREGLRALLHVQRRHHRRRPGRDDHDAERLRRPVGAGRRRWDAGRRDRRRRPGRVRRGVRRSLRGQALDRQGARPPDRHHPGTQPKDER